MKNKLINLSGLLISILPILLITGPLLPEIAIFLLIIFFLVISNKNEKKEFFSNIYFRFFILFWILLVTISLINQNYNSIIKSFFYIRFGLFFISVSFFLYKNDKIYKKIFLSLSLTILFLFIDSTYQFFNVKNLFGFIAIDHPRVSSIFLDEYILGSFTVRFSPLMLACYFYCYHDNSKMKYLTTILFFLSFIIIFISGERMALLYEFMVILFLIIFVIKNKKFKVYSFLSVFCILSVTLIFNQNLKQRIITQTLDEMGFTTNKTYQNEFSVEKPIFKDFYLVSPAHQSYFKTAFNMFREKPIVGHGIKSYKEKCSIEKYRANVESCTTHPHNTYFQLLAETGFFGFLIVFIFFIFLLINLFLYLLNKKKIDNYNLCLICCLLLTFWPIATTGNFFNNWLSIVYFFPFGFIKNKLGTRI